MQAFDLKSQAKFTAEKMAKVDLVASPHLICGMNCFEPGQSQKVHAHSGADKLYVVVEGTGQFIVGEETRVLSAGELLYVPEEVPHGVNNTSGGRLSVMIVITPNFKH